MAEQKKNIDWDKIVNAVVSIGAAVVIFGAWAKYYTNHLQTLC